jgi:hypothetical protein
MRVALFVVGCLLPGVLGVASVVRNSHTHKTGFLNSLLQVFGLGEVERVTEGELETATRMQYWASAGTSVPAGDRYLLFDYDAGGLNNIRMGWEYSGIIAKVTGRTLVLPSEADVSPRHWPEELEVLARRNEEPCYIHAYGGPPEHETTAW